MQHSIEILSKRSVEPNKREDKLIITIVSISNPKRFVKLNELAINCWFGLNKSDMKNDFVYSYDLDNGNCFVFNSGQNATNHSVDFKHVNDDFTKRELRLDLFIGLANLNFDMPAYIYI